MVTKKLRVKLLAFFMSTVKLYNSCQKLSMIKNYEYENEKPKH